MIDLGELINRQQRSGFADLAGARVAAFFPISDRLLNEIITQELPPNAPVSDVSLEALAGNRVAVRARLTRAPLVPALKLTLTIVQQPSFPDNPVLALQIGWGALGSLAASVTKFFAALPPGIRVEGDRLLVDIRELLARRGQEWLLRYVVDLQVTTEAGTAMARVNLSI